MERIRSDLDGALGQERGFRRYEMKKTAKRFTLSVAVLALAVVPAEAQTGWGALGINSSWMNPAHHGRGPQTDIGFDETWGVGGNLDFWFGTSRRWGLGLQGPYSGWTEWDTNFGGDFGEPVKFGMYDASLQWRLVDVDFGTKWLPWLSLGVGGVTSNPDDDPDSHFPARDDICLDSGGRSGFCR